jgi:hypothetical protein
MYEHVQYTYRRFTYGRNGLGRWSHQAERLSFDSEVPLLDPFSRNISKAVKNRPGTSGIGRIVATRSIDPAVWILGNAKFFGTFCR